MWIITDIIITKIIIYRRQVQRPLSFLNSQVSERELMIDTSIHDNQIVKN